MPWLLALEADLPVPSTGKACQAFNLIHTSSDLRQAHVKTAGFDRQKVPKLWQGVSPRPSFVIASSARPISACAAGFTKSLPFLPLCPRVLSDLLKRVMDRSSARSQFLSRISQNFQRFFQNVTMTPVIFGENHKFSEFQG